MNSCKCVHLCPCLDGGQKFSNPMARRRSFINWMFGQVNLLFEAGFYVAGRNGEDLLRCFKCGVETSTNKWLPKESPMQAHRRLQGSCTFIQHCYWNILAESSNVRSNTDESRPYARQPENGETFKAVSHDPETSCPTENEDCNIYMKYPNYADYSCRQESFSKCRWEMFEEYRHASMTGFFYSECYDVLKCCCCGLRLYTVENEKEMWSRHAMFTPNCFFLNDNKSQKFTSKVQATYKPRCPAMHEFDDRLASFRTKWKSYDVQTPEKLAEAGFFYCDASGSDDNGVRCYYFYCELLDVTHTGSPWEKHARRFPECMFVRMKRGDLFIKNAVSNSMNV